MYLPKGNIGQMKNTYIQEYILNNWSSKYRECSKLFKPWSKEGPTNDEWSTAVKAWESTVTDGPQIPPNIQQAYKSKPPENHAQPRSEISLSNNSDHFRFTRMSSRKHYLLTRHNSLVDWWVCTQDIPKQMELEFVEKRKIISENQECGNHFPNCW